MRSAEFYSDKLGRANIQEIKLLYTVTGALTWTDHNEGAALVSGGAITDAAAAAFLGETSPAFTASAFDATSMGNDVIGGVLNCEGQIKELIGMRAHLMTADTEVTVTKGCEDSSNLTATTLKTECAKSAGGNIGFKINMGNTPDFDTISAGLIEITFFVKLK